MMKTFNYILADVNIEVHIDGSAWAKGMLNYLCLPHTGLKKSEKKITLFLHNTDPNQLEQIIPLPDRNALVRTSSLRAGREIAKYSYHQGAQRWVEYETFGRIMFDRSNFKSVATHLSNSGIVPLYGHITFGYNPILALLAEYGYETVHASCARIGDKGFLFCGQSGKGKSTSAYAILRKGHSILADDRIMVRNNSGYSAFAISDVIKLQQEARDNFFPELNSIEPQVQIDNEYYYKASLFGKNSFINKTGINYLCVFERSSDTKSRIEPINPARVVGELFPVSMSNYNAKAMQDKFNFLMDFVSQIDCHKIYAGTDMDRLVETLETFAAI